MMKFEDAALRLAGLGWAVFPVSPGLKIPAIPKTAPHNGRGVLDATTDPDVIREWGRRYRHANVGIACGLPSGITVLDIDPKNNGVETMQAFKAAKQVLTPTIIARTPSGGWHYYYRFEQSLLNSKSLLGPGVDVRNTGGYVVAPPSVLAGGYGYHWINSPLGGDIPRMPIWAVQKLKPRPPSLMTGPLVRVRDADAAFRGVLKFLENAGEGERNASLYWAALRAAEGGWTDEGHVSLLVDSAAKIGLDRKESVKTIGSAFKRGRRLG
jgi:hypothetical protein